MTQIDTSTVTLHQLNNLIPMINELLTIREKVLANHEDCMDGEWFDYFNIAKESMGIVAKIDRKLTETRLTHRDS